MAVDPTGGLATALVGFGVVLAIAGYFIMKGRWMKWAMVGGLVALLIGAAFGGLAFANVGPLVAGPVYGGAPGAIGLYDAVIKSTSAITGKICSLNVPSLNSCNGAVTQYISTTGKAITVYAPHRDWTGNSTAVSYLYSFSLAVTVVNLNTGNNQQTYSYAASMTSVPTILSTQGVPTPAMNFTSDQSRYAITWTMSGTGAPTGYQLGAIWQTSGFAVGASGTLTAALPFTTGTLVNIPATSNIAFTFLEGGVALTLTLFDTG